MENYRNLVDTTWRYHYDLLCLERFSGNPDVSGPEEAQASEEHTMSNGEQTRELAEPRYAYAIVASGIVSPSSDIIAFVDGDGHKTPVVVGVFDDREKAESYMGRLQTKVRKIKNFGRPDFVKGTPIFGIQQVMTVAKRTRKPLTPEAKAALVEKLQGGRHKPTAAKGK